MSTDVEIAAAEVAEDESLLERRLRFLSMRNAGGTFSSIAARWNKAQADAARAAGADPSTAKRVSTTTVRKDVEAAKLQIVGEATREGMIAEAYSVILDVRRASYAAAMGGDPDHLKIVLSTVRDQRELFGLDSPKRMAVGVGTDVEFAETLLSLINEVGSTASAELAQVARSENSFIDVETVEIPAGPTDETGNSPVDPVEPTGKLPVSAEDWSNL